MAIRLAEVRSFCDSASAAKSPDALYDLMQDITDRMGFAHFALVHHVDTVAPDTGTIRLVDYPRSWMDIFEERRLYAADPIHRASQQTSVGFAWNNVEALIALSPRDRAVLTAARDVGIGDGFTIPAHIPGEVNGSCSFATASGVELDEEQLPFVQLVGNFAFEAARRVNRSVGSHPRELPRLTDRQVECVALVARGKTDWEIARILGVGSETVSQHLKDARDRYGVTKRTMLAMRALFDGSISFADVFGR
ncbi:LuxR family transcriptional regulator [Sphingobium yanoikuyae]|uniref:LuxR family transcriptional regulator n=1 Tax=Sphingobium yanoikuyae TaxID=13690 RepID=UPI0007A73340|nr:LuxR family transcriptional regulator [Sphingobium yanoikuyae]KZC75965.1 LuxR family transcriptional regulator [Sphingobium yanoikuyae]